MERPFTEKEKIVNEALRFGPGRFEMSPGRSAGDPEGFGTGDMGLAVTTVCGA